MIFFKIFREKYFGIYVSFLIIISIWLLSITGFFSIVDGFIYDKTVQATPQPKIKQSDYLLIEVPSPMILNKSDYWDKKIEQIDSFNPRAIVFTFEVETVKNKDNIFFGFNEKISTDKKNKGFISIQKDSYGIHRKQIDLIKLDNQEVFSLELVVSNYLNKGIKEPLGEYIVNFNGGEKFPIFNIDDLFKNAMIEPLLKNKIVVIGEELNKYGFAIKTPLNTNMSFLEFFTYSLDTLIQNKQIYNPSRYDELIQLAIIIVLGLVFFKFLPSSVMILFSFGAVGLYSLLAWILLSYYNYWLPLSEIIAAIFLLTYTLLRQESLLRIANDNILLLNASDKLRERALHKTFFNSSEYWEYVASMVDQSLNLNKCIFLEKYEDKKHVKEVISIGCSLDNINELRRDFTREPYKSAILEKTHIALKNRQYFKDLSDDEIEFISPLSFYGEILGFWAFTIKKEALAENKVFDSLVEDFSKEIGELLYRRKEWQKAINKNDNNYFNELLQAKNNHFVHQEVTKTLTIIEKRLMLLDTIFNTIEDGIVLYDIFGRLYHINNKMSLLLANEDIKPFDYSAGELLNKLSDLSIKDSRKIFSSVIIDKKSYRFPVHLKNTKEISFNIKISPITKEMMGEKFNDNFPFEIYGVLIELSDVTLFKKLTDMKTDLVIESSRNIRDFFQPFVTVASLLKREDLEIDERKKYSYFFKESFNKLMFEYSKMEDLLSQDIFSISTKHYPIAYYKELNTAVSSIKKEFFHKNISFNIEFSDKFSLCFASPSILLECFEKILRFLANDAGEETIISINIIEEQNQISLVFGNEGFGMPNDKFKMIIEENKESEDKYLKELIETISHIKEWKGEFKAFSQFGEGYVVIMNLIRYGK